MRRPWMPLLFFYRSTPELKYVPDEERQVFWQRARKGALSNWGPWAVLALWFAGIIVIGRVGRQSPFWSASTVSETVLSIIFGLAMGVLAVNVVYRRARQRLRADLVATGRCRDCGYDLRASPERCPECGTLTLDTAKT